MPMRSRFLVGHADMVVGDRLSNGTYAKQNRRAFHGFGNDLVRDMIKWIYGYEYSDVMTGYRAMSKPFIKTFPVLSCGFQIETELSIHAVDRRWRIADVPVEYRDRPEGSVSKLNTVKDGLKVIAMIGTLFKDYRPLKFFSLVALAFCIGGLFGNAGSDRIPRHRPRTAVSDRHPRRGTHVHGRPLARHGLHPGRRGESRASNGSSAYTARPRTNKAKSMPVSLTERGAI